MDKAHTIYIGSPGDMNLLRSSYFKYLLHWMKYSFTKVKAKRSKKTLQSLIMEMQSKEYFCP